ncbi:MAG TPA: hypothetical protein VIJ53_03620, partial [Acidobacteriaceae bacterium]
MIKDRAPAEILLVDNDPAVAEMIRTALAGSASFALTCVHQLSEGLARLSQGGIAVVLLELFLPDSAG